jgi:transcriptional regulator with XRE-family HTH domain
MLYERIKKLCDEQGISIMECEKRAGLGNGVIGAWRMASPRINSVQAVAKALGVSVSDLLEETDESES